MRTSLFNRFVAWAAACGLAMGAASMTAAQTPTPGGTASSSPGVATPAPLAPLGNNNPAVAQPGSSPQTVTNGTGITRPGGTVPGAQTTVGPTTATGVGNAGINSANVGFQRSGVGVFSRSPATTSGQPTVVLPGTVLTPSAVPMGPNINPNSPTAVTPTTAATVTPQPLSAQTSVQPIETVLGPVTSLPSAFDINGNFVGFATVPSGTLTAGAIGPTSTNVADPSVQALPPTPLAPLDRSMLFERSIADRTQLPAPARPLGPVNRSALYDDQLPDPTAASAVNPDSAAAVQAQWALVRDNRGRVVLGADFNGDGLADRYFNRFPTDTELRSAGIILTPQAPR